MGSNASYLSIKCSSPRSAAPLLAINSDEYDGEWYRGSHLEGTMEKRFHVWAKLVMIQLLGMFSLAPEI